MQKYLDFKEIKNHTKDLEVIYNIIINLGWYFDGIKRLYRKCKRLFF